MPVKCTPYTLTTQLIAHFRCFLQQIDLNGREAAGVITLLQWYCFCEILSMQAKTVDSALAVYIFPGVLLLFIRPTFFNTQATHVNSHQKHSHLRLLTSQ
jgi:hypothetical protein